MKSRNEAISCFSGNKEGAHYLSFRKIGWLFEQKIIPDCVWQNMHDMNHDIDSKSLESFIIYLYSRTKVPHGRADLSELRCYYVSKNQ